MSEAAEAVAGLGVEALPGQTGDEREERKK